GPAGRSGPDRRADPPRRLAAAARPARRRARARQPAGRVDAAGAEGRARLPAAVRGPRPSGERGLRPRLPPGPLARRGGRGHLPLVPARVVVALLTPFRASGEPDEPALAAHVEWLVEAGVDALMPCGTTGEGPLLEPDEVLRVVTATVQAAGGRAPVQAHVGRPSTAATIE